MLDAANQYPLGDEVLSEVITESCLAKAEQYVEQKDAATPDAVHSRAFLQCLAAAIDQDKVRAAPDTLGVDQGQGHMAEDYVHRRQTERIYWDGGGYTGYI